MHFRQRQIRGHAGRLDDGLVHLREHLLHGLVIHAAPSHFGRELVLFIDLVEGGRLALRLGGQLKRVGAGLVDVRLGVLLGGRDFLESIVDVRRRVGLLDRNSLDLDARVIGIEHALEGLGHLAFDIGPPVAHGVVETDLADD